MSDNTETLILRNVRLSYPHLFERSKTPEGKEGKYNASLILDPKTNAKDIEALESMIADQLKMNLKGASLPADRKCLRSGEGKGDGYEGNMFLSASSNTAPMVLNNNSPQPVTNAGDAQVYAGCYVDAKVSMWTQNNQYGKRVNANLHVVKFVGDGDAFSSGHLSKDEALDGFDFDSDDANLDDLLDA